MKATEQKKYTIPEVAQIARFLGILPNELKRYETYSVQPKEIDEDLRKL